MRTDVVMRPAGWFECWKWWWFTICRSPGCLHLVSGDCGGTGFTFCRALGGDKVRMWKREKVRREKTSSFISVSHRFLKWLISIIHHLDWVRRSPCLVLSLTNPSDSCVKGGTTTVTLSGGRAIEVQRGRVKAWKGYPVETVVLGPRGETPHVSMRMHAFPCESISKAGVHYQHNGPADGCSCHTRLSTLEDHSRRPCSEGGQGRVTGQGRAAGGCMSCSLDHIGTFQIPINIPILL